MYAILFTNLLAIAFAVIGRILKSKYALAFSFLIITLFLSIRYDFGNDYMAYKNMFEEIHNISSQNTYYEKGWIFVNLIFPNFFLLIIFLSILSSIVYYRFINTYVNCNYWWFSVFLYVFNPNYMLIQSSTMRQTVAILIFIISIKFILERRLIVYLLMCGFAFLFHQSALILVPVYWIARIKINRIIKLVVLASFIALYIVGFQLKDIIGQLSIILFQGRYDHFLLETTNTSYLNAFIYIALLVVILYIHDIKNEKDRVFINITILALFFFPLSSFVPMIARMGYYFLPITLVSYPIIANDMRPIYRNIFITCIVMVILTRFHAIVFSNTWRDHFLVYKTIFSEL